ncbi:MAG: hypothetical protein IJT76_08555, partial [Clostridia bacterium]|nr:hypothetical protein [Clostridia bacterium]
MIKYQLILPYFYAKEQAKRKFFRKQKAAKPLQLVKEPSFLLSKSEGFAVFGQKQRENKARIRTFPAPFCQLFQIHR